MDSLVTRYSRDEPLAIDHGTALLTFENIPYVKYGASGPIKIGFNNTLFAPDENSPSRRLIANINHLIDEFGASLDGNPLLWRSLGAFITEIWKLGDTQGLLSRAIAPDGKVTKNIVHGLYFYDWLLGNHITLGDIALPLALRIITELNYDLAATEKLISNINQYNGRPSIDLKARTKLEKSLIEAETSSYKSSKSLRRQRVTLWERYGRGLHGINDSAYRAFVDRLLVLADSDEQTTFKDRLQNLEAFSNYIDALPETVTIFKGGVLLNSERIRKGPRGKLDNESAQLYEQISEVHLKRVGYSFSTNPIIAEYFSYRTALNYKLFRESALSVITRDDQEFFKAIENARPVVVRYEVAKSDIFGLYNGRQEEEVIIKSNSALRLRDYQFSLPVGRIGEARLEAFMVSRLTNPLDESKDSPYPRTRYLSPTNVSCMVQSQIRLGKLLRAQVHKSLLT